MDEEMIEEFDFLSHLKPIKRDELIINNEYCITTSILKGYTISAVIFIGYSKIFKNPIFITEAGKRVTNIRLIFEYDDNFTNPYFMNLKYDLYKNNKET